MASEQFPPSQRTLKENKKFFDRIKKKMPKAIDETVIRLHEEVFEKIDCKTCANCCKTTSPIFKDRDINVLSKFFKVRPSVFASKYLHLDSDGDYVLNSAPCPFLNENNLCSVYEHRPQACQGYPHTDEPVFRKIIHITQKNTAVCPAVFQIVESLKRLF